MFSVDYQPIRVKNKKNNFFRQGGVLYCKVRQQAFWSTSHDIPAGKRLWTHNMQWGMAIVELSKNMAATKCREIDLE